MTTVSLSDETIALIAKRFRTLGEPFRLRLLQVLEPGEKTVNELVLALHGNQPNISKHLSILHEAGLVSRRREGTSIYYAIGDPFVFHLCELVCRNAAQKSREEYAQLTAALAAPVSRRRTK
mgnify:CR=1 FL=1